MSFQPNTGGPLPSARPPARIYLAGASAEIARVRTIADALIDAGHKLTEAWWERMADASARGWSSDRDVPEAYLRESWRREARRCRVTSEALGAFLPARDRRPPGGFSPDRKRNEERASSCSSDCASIGLPPSALDVVGAVATAIAMSIRVAPNGARIGALLCGGAS